MIPGKNLIGVFTADFSVQDVTTYLSRLIQSRSCWFSCRSVSGKPFAISSGIDVPNADAFAACQQAISQGSSILADGQPKGFTVRLQGEPYLLTAAPHWLPDGFGFITGVLGSENEFVGSARHNLALTATVGSLAIAIAAIVAIWLSGQLAKPLKISKPRLGIWSVSSSFLRSRTRALHFVKSLS